MSATSMDIAVGSSVHRHRHRHVRLANDRAGLAVSCRNIVMLHLLEKVAGRFNEAGIPLMVLKGGALNMMIYDRPDQREMADIDLMIWPDRIDESLALLREMGCKRWRVFVREDFFPKYYFEVEYQIGDIFPVMLDVHVRPFRPLRYVKLLSDNIFWGRARECRIGDATVLVPCCEDMFVHLCVHCAFHGDEKAKWREDICRWVDRYGGEMDWGMVLATAGEWRLSLAVLRGMEAAESDGDRLAVPDEVRRGLREVKTGWRDRLVLWHAPLDEGHPIVHLLGTVLTTPDIGMVMGFVRATLLPGRAHMRQWYGREHIGWLVSAHLLRLVQPVTKRVWRFWPWSSNYVVERVEGGGVRVVARKKVLSGQIIGRYRIRKFCGDERFAVIGEYDDGRAVRYTMDGGLRFMGVAEEWNARLDGLRVVAVGHIKVGDKIRIGEKRTRMSRNEVLSDKSTYSPV